jgi:hypothetical protein
MPGDPKRACFSRLMTLSSDTSSLDSLAVTRAIDDVLGCGGRYNCRSHFACSCIASELANRLMERFR